MLALALDGRVVVSPDYMGIGGAGSRFTSARPRPKIP